VVLQQDQTAYIDDLQRRPDLAAPFEESGSYRSILATPVRLAGRPAGVLVVCSLAPNHWTQEQFRLIEWAAAQVAPLLDSLRWQVALQQRAEAVEQANQAKDQFLATLSHELRTPLTPVLAAAGALEMDARLPEDARAELAMIRRNVAIQSRLIDDLLDLTRISRGKLDLIQQELEVMPLLREAAAIVAADLDAKEQILVQQISVPAGRKLHGDGARLQQVFWNLLKNAVKFSPRGSRLTLDAHVAAGHPRKRELDGDRVVVRIADEGVGIEPADLERIFQPFEQAASARRRGGNVGLGLGLSIAKAIVELHDGRLLASSAGPGRGSVFMVELPLLERVCDEATVVQVPAAAAPAAGTENSAGRILLVEDHGDTGRVMARLLRRAGYTVVHAETVGAALEAWASESFDLVVSDLGLPDGSGLDLMRQLREQDGRVPGICMSGFGMESDVRASQEAGFAEHLIKPVDMQQLHAAIRRLLSTVPAGGDR
jgi:signal transduction histidine kinase/CheY-like chemotaxis protein